MGSSIRLQLMCEKPAIGEKGRSFCLLQSGLVKVVFVQSEGIKRRPSVVVKLIGMKGGEKRSKTTPTGATP